MHPMFAAERHDALCRGFVPAAASGWPKTVLTAANKTSVACGSIAQMMRRPSRRKVTKPALCNRCRCLDRFALLNPRRSPMKPAARPSLPAVTSRLRMFKRDRWAKALNDFNAIALSMMAERRQTKKAAGRDDAADWPREHGKHIKASHEHEYDAVSPKRATALRILKLRRRVAGRVVAAGRYGSGAVVPG